MTKPRLMHTYEAQSVLISHNLREGALFITLYISEHKHIDRNYVLKKYVGVRRSQGEGKEKRAAAG